MKKTNPIRNPFRKKDFSSGGEDYNRMIRANAARNDENTSAWQPGALNRLENKHRLEYWMNYWKNIKDHWRSWWHN